MTSSIRLGRIAGIEIGVNWSWLVVFALIVWSIALDLSDRYASLSDAGAFVAAIVAAALFFGSLLAHELGHAVVARREGMEIDGITLWLFGGVAKFKGMFPSAGAEFRIAIAGPIVSLLIGLVCVGLAWLLQLTDVADGILGWLGVTNLILLAFNMLPALPLDGGRVLRSALWAARDDFRWATRLAATVGRGFGFVFIGLGVVALISWGAVGGAWLAFIGWFLLTAASQEARYVLVRDALGGLRVDDLMVHHPASVSPDLTLGQFMDEIVWNRRYTTYPVVDGDGHPLGLLPFRRVAQVPRGEWDTRTVRQCMVALDDVPTLRPEQELTDALPELGDGVGRALVLDRDGRLAGILSVTDVMRALEAGGPRRPAARAG
ncbi:MAG TPA: site-2 protease family protein [Gaiellaceae bacterium]|nr:site-2 protease family protein [Gaiellaceae bacterium]